MWGVDPAHVILYGGQGHQIFFGGLVGDGINRTQVIFGLDVFFFKDARCGI